MTRRERQCVRACIVGKSVCCVSSGGALRAGLECEIFLSTKIYPPRRSLGSIHKSLFFFVGVGVEHWSS